MSELLTSIKSRGYWRVVIRPTTFVEDRIPNLYALQRILEKTSVQLKGWDFPHIDRFRELDQGPDWVGQEIVWGEIQEMWRFFQSGQLIHYFAIPEDWKAADQQLTSDAAREAVWSHIRDFVARFTEIFELATRLTFIEAADDATHLEILVGNIQDHRLHLPSLATEAGWIPVCQQPSWSCKADFSNLQLVASTNDLASKWAAVFFKCFKPSPTINLIKEAQSEFLTKISR